MNIGTGRPSPTTGRPHQRRLREELLHVGQCFGIEHDADVNEDLLAGHRPRLHRRAVAPVAAAALELVPIFNKVMGW